MIENETVEQPSSNVESQDNAQQVEQGSQFGKFKDAKSLYDAYNNLQAEFTKKCQKLSEIEKNQKIEQDPIFCQDDWQDKVSSFLNEHNDAKKFASEISQEILSNPSLKNDKNALELAWAKIIGQKYKPVDEIVNDDKFIEDYVMSSEQIKQKVLSRFMQDLDNNKIPPFVVASGGGDIAFVEKPKANNLDEAKTLVEAIFNVKKEN